MDNQTLVRGQLPPDYFLQRAAMGNIETADVDAQVILFHSAIVVREPRHAHAIRHILTASPVGDLWRAAGKLFLTLPPRIVQREREFVE
jgi:hypothetical protein